MPPSKMPQPQSKMETPFYGMLHPKTVEKTGPARRHFVAASGEFVGTFLFLFMAFLGHLMSVTAAGSAGSSRNLNNSTVVYIALSYGFSLLVSAWILYRISGGLFNPAVTLGLVVTGNVPVVRGIILVPVQIIAATCAAAVVSVIVPGDIALTQTTLNPDMSVAQGFFLEMFLTAELVFTILMLAAEKSKDTFIAPIGIGLCLFVVEIAGIYYTGASVNPARSFGPCVASRQFTTYHWIYWIGPLFGALVAAGFYHFVKFMNYEDVNPGQDSAGADSSDDEEQQAGGGHSETEERKPIGGGYAGSGDGVHRSSGQADGAAPPRSRGTGRQVDRDGYGQRQAGV